MQPHVAARRLARRSTPRFESVPQFSPRRLSLAVAAAALALAQPVAAADPPQPLGVSVPGSFNSEQGCPGDWQPDCPDIALTLDASDGVWQASLNMPAGHWEYKAALNGSWDENYGANAVRGGGNIALDQANEGPVKFYYDHASHWITSDRNSRIVTAAGDFQAQLGCPGDWQPDCLRSWLQDPDGDGVFSFTTTALAAGSYQVKAALNERWDENYGQDGVAGGANIGFQVASDGATTTFVFDSARNTLSMGDAAPAGSLTLRRAHWLAPDVIAWAAEAAQADTQYTLHAAADGVLSLGPDGVSGGERFTLSPDPAGMPAELAARFPHLAGLPVFRLGAADAARAGELLRGAIAVSAQAGDGRALDASGTQNAGALDTVYRYDGPLGLQWAGDTPSLHVWAPTARNLRLLRYASAGASAPLAEHDLQRDPASGVWRIQGDASWNRQYYLLEVEVFVPAEGRFVTSLVTDPYSLGAAADGLRSQFVNLADADLKPAGWDALRKPGLAAFEDIALYELHIRDFSINDPSVPPVARGGYGAFALPDSLGMRHLRSLAQAGLSHVHLLPTFDYATVPERRSDQQQPAGDLAGYAPDAPDQQAAVAAVAESDGFNWGYDPLHYTLPEGSYASEPDGTARIREFRQMVAGLARAGLRVVMDVVYNHTSASGQAARSVLDKLVPGYYHRLDANGAVLHDSCCEDTASEHAMMEKLIVDSVRTWAREYKVDGFRFDIMGFHSRANIEQVRAALDALTPETDGVDGKKIYLYGEGWNFGDVANDRRFVQATQRNMAGTGVGSFSDRIRDAARGGNPFGGLQEQGFVTGLHVAPNALDQGDSLATLLALKDVLLVGLAGNLADVVIEDHTGTTRRGDEVAYADQRAGYTADPQEVINYVSAHDNETLFDAIQYKAPRTLDSTGRTRIQALGLALVTYAQGIPFFHAGDELLRSKSLDRNSYNSGDWFNLLDWRYRDNGWGRGLPPQADNGANWPLMAQLLADPALTVAPRDIQTSLTHFRNALAVRRDTPLLRLRSRDAVQNALRFHNTGPAQLPGLIAMETFDPEGRIDHANARVLVLFNADDEMLSFASQALAGAPWQLHPQLHADPLVHGARYDPLTQRFDVPARTAAVFVVKRPAAEQFALVQAWWPQTARAAGLTPAAAQRLAGLLAQAHRRYAAGQGSAARSVLEQARALGQRWALQGQLDSAEAGALQRSLDELLRALQV